MSDKKAAPAAEELAPEAHAIVEQVARGAFHAKDERQKDGSVKRTITVGGETHVLILEDGKNKFV